MKAKLIKKSDGWYNLYDGGIGIGSTNTELQGYKLSKLNCDEIFGIVDVEKLADFYGAEANGNIDFKFGANQGFEDGFNKAMELNKDKLFTEDDVNLAFVLGKNKDESRINKLINSKIQPTEIEVEIEMEVVPDFYSRSDEDGSIFTSNKKEQPKLDSSGCLILKKL